MKLTYKSHRKKMFSSFQKLEIINYYLAGNSTVETGKKFDIVASSVYNILRKAEIKRRSQSEGNSLKWQNKSFRENQIMKRIGKPSGAKGKKWKVNHRIEKPNIRGDKNPNWKGGTTKLIQLIKGLPEYSFWRMEIFRRDNWTCQKCKAKNKSGEKYIFDAHHIYPISKIIADFSIKTIEEAISCKELWDINNGQCLCRNCHKLTDSWGVNSN